MIAGSVLVLGGAAAAVVIMHPFSHNETASSTTASTSRASAPLPATAGATSAPAVSQPGSPASPASAAPVTQQQAAQNLADMLSQSVSERAAIIQAVRDVQDCGPSLNQDPQVFESAASSRRTLLAQLASMAGRSALPGQLLQDLTGAWQASVTADGDFAQWANDEIANGCVQNDTSDPGAAAATGPDNQATSDKQAFVSLWNPIATQYGLSTYTQDQL